MPTYSIPWHIVVAFGELLVSGGAPALGNTMVSAEISTEEAFKVGGFGMFVVALPVVGAVTMGVRFLDSINKLPINWKTHLLSFVYVAGVAVASAMMGADLMNVPLGSVAASTAIGAVVLTVALGLIKLGMYYLALPRSLQPEGTFLLGDGMNGRLELGMNGDPMPHTAPPAPLNPFNACSRRRP